MKQQAFNFDFRPAMGAEDFIVSSSNENVVKWLDNHKEWVNPFLVIVGDAGCGKTHLCNVWQSMTNAIVLKGIESELPTIHCDGYYYIDNVDEKFDIAREHYLFHLYNALISGQGRCLLTASAHPVQWNITLNDTKSRILACPSVDVEKPDSNLLELLLVKALRERQILIKQEVILYIINRIERDFNSIHEVVEALDKASLIDKKPVTLALARDVLGKVYDNK